ncbi:protein tyrosine phosphatase [Enterovirga sp. DB1703]|uniref:Protein tyrosine phosphatase n=1 Tax=Enterovirga aerilata TaxID=2730920 RepID=A0A849I658_9HYPH|nr:protein tyrosine phosphatase [Enterovirga sp. DB1703]
MLIGCPAASLREVCAERAPSHILLLVSPGIAAPVPPPAPLTLALVFNDIPAERPGFVAPRTEDVARILAFGRSWDGGAPLLASCQAGVSRSTAALFIIACACRPDLPEAAIAERLRHAAPSATPNPLLVSLADRILGRQDRMIQAVAGIGRGADYVPYRSFELALPPAG